MHVRAPGDVIVPRRLQPFARSHIDWLLSATDKAWICMRYMFACSMDSNREDPQARGVGLITKSFWLL